MRRLPPHLAPLGYSPRRYLPLSPAPVLGMAERLTDLREMQLLFANGELGGYWPADPAYVYADSAGTIPASVNGVVGYRTDVALGKHAVQATTGNKPYLRCTPTTGKYWYDPNTATGAMNVTFVSALGSACTIATVTPEGVSILENQTVGTTYNICPPYSYNSDVLIINRALTPAERALVTRVMQRSVPQLGSELVTNGGFETDTSWWTGGIADLSVVNGRMRVANSIDNSPGIAYQAISSFGPCYCKTDAVAGTAPSIALSLHNTAPTTGSAFGIIAGGTGYKTVVYNGVISYMGVGNRGGNGLGLYNDYDNISCRRIL